MLRVSASYVIPRKLVDVPSGRVSAKSSTLALPLVFDHDLVAGVGKPVDGSEGASVDNGGGEPRIGAGPAGATRPVPDASAIAECAQRALAPPMGLSDWKRIYPAVPAAIGRVVGSRDSRWQLRSTDIISPVGMQLL